MQPDTSPLYIRGGSPIPEVVNPERVVFIVRAFIDPPERDEEQLPEMEAPQVEEVRVRGFDRPLDWPVAGIL